MPPNQGLRGMTDHPQWSGLKGLMVPLSVHGGRQCSDLNSGDRIIVNHHTSEVLFALERGLRDGFVLKRCLWWWKEEEVFKSLRHRLLSDVKLLGVVGTLNIFQTFVGGTVKKWRKREEVKFFGLRKRDEKWMKRL